MNNQGNVWNIDLISQLKATFKLTNTDVVSLQPWILLLMEEISHLYQVLKDVTIAD